MSTVPLPCPFCGSCSIGAYDGSTFRWLAAKCNECGATAGEVRINTLIPRDEAWPQANEDALQEWNRRAQPEPHWANEGHVGMAHGGQPQPEAQRVTQEMVDVLDEGARRAEARISQLAEMTARYELLPDPVPDVWLVVFDDPEDDDSTSFVIDDARAKNFHLESGFMPNHLERVYRAQAQPHPEARELTDDEL